MALITCPECGKQMSTNAESCPHCGAFVKKKSINNSSPQNAEANSEPLQKATPKKKSWMWILIAVIAIGGGVAAWSMTNGGSAEELYNEAMECHKKGDPGNIKKAVKLWNKSAQKGYAPAQRELGLCYTQGEGVEKNLAKAVEWTTKAAEQGDAPAQYELGVLYFEGTGVAQDMAKAVYWFEKAAEKGYPYALHNLALLYYNGVGVAADYNKAVSLMRRAAEAGIEASKQALAELGY